MSTSDPLRYVGEIPDPPWSARRPRGGPRFDLPFAFAYNDADIAAFTAAQAELVTSDTLPAQIRDRGQEALSRAGVVFHGLVPKDPLFQYVTLPAGWRKVPELDNPLRTNLVDEYGSIRAIIYCRTSLPTDRIALLTACGRYAVTLHGTEDKTQMYFAVEDRRGGHPVGKLLYTTPPVAANRLTMLFQAERECEMWLTTHFPDWQDPAAYWDAEDTDAG